MTHSMASIGALLAALSLASCVPQGKYDAAVADATKTRTRLEASEKERSQARIDLNALHRELTDTKVALATSQQEIELAGGIAIACGQALDEQTGLNEELMARMEDLGRDVDALRTTKIELMGSLERARAGLEELRHAQADAEARAVLFRDVAERLRTMVDAGELQIVLRSGRMVLVLPSDVLFDSGRAKVGRKGRAALREVGAVLARVPERRFQVSGHTDSDPIHTSAFASNWELSSARALEVVQVLIAAGMRPAALSLAGYAEFDPVAPNDTPPNKAKNRRIEIALQPNISELVELPPAPGQGSPEVGQPAAEATAPAP